MKGRISRAQRIDRPLAKDRLSPDYDYAVAVAVVVVVGEML